MTEKKPVKHELDLPEGSDLETALKKANEGNLLPLELNMKTAHITRGSETLLRFRELNNEDTIEIKEYSVK